MRPLPPLPPEALALAALGVLLGWWLLRRLRGGADAAALARQAELDRYRALVGRAEGLLQSGRLTAAKLVIDEELRSLRLEAHQETRSRHIPAEVRRAVFARDGGACVRCQAVEDLQFDHIVPWSRGGAHSEENLELLCGRCNREKGDRVA